MSYDEARRHLDPVREHLERLKVLHISTAYMSQRKGEPSAIFNLDVEYIGAYLRDDKLVVMMKFDDTKVNSLHLDVAYEGIRERTKKILINTFPGLRDQDLSIYVVDAGGAIADVDW
jgi:hypothetical protein